MTHKNEDFDAMFDRELEAIRNEQPDPQVADKAAERVWSAVQAEFARHPVEATPRLSECQDFQALIPAHLSASLQEARELLLKDHLRSCVPCRRALKDLRKQRQSGNTVVRTSKMKRRRGFSEWSWGIAAAALLAIAVFGLKLDVFGLNIRTGGMVTIEQVDGELLRIGENGAAPVQAGDSFLLATDDALRTARGSTAMLTLSDGSRVELNERTELGITESRNRFTDTRRSSMLDLHRGNVIVDAADQGDAALYVKTGDADVTVHGTLFAVNHGVQGTRVSVIEGAVAVDYDRDSTMLAPGEQLGTKPAVERIPIEEAIAWSPNVEQHLALLREVTSLGRELDQAIDAPELRFQTELLQQAPSDTVVYVAFPNIAETLNQAYDMLQQKVSTNPVLDEWWTATMIESGEGAELEQVLRKIRDFGEHFGDEIVISVPRGVEGELGEPYILSRVDRPEQFIEFLSEQMPALDGAPSIAIYRGEVPVPVQTIGTNDSPDLHIWLWDGFFAASGNAEALQRLAANGARDEAEVRFTERVAESYARGVEWLVAVDLATLVGEVRESDGKDTAILESLGLLDIQHLIAERKHRVDQTDNALVLSFNQPRRGVASWLAEPSPMGSLNFVSQNATVVGAFAMKRPEAVVDELFAMFEEIDPEALAGLRAFEEERGLNIRNDFAAPLGGEFAFALDGPMLPIPSWKLILEVYDPNALQHTMKRLADDLNDVAQQHGVQGVELKQSRIGKNDSWSLKSLDTGLSVHWTYSDGYMIAVPTRALLNRALQTAKNGTTLETAPRFAALMPNDREVHFSALFYHNFGPALGPTLEHLSRAAEQGGGRGAEVFNGMADAMNATLAYAYGEKDQIRVASTSEGGMFSFGLRMLLNVQGLFDIGSHLEEATSMMEQGGANGVDNDRVIEPAPALQLSI